MESTLADIVASNFSPVKLSPEELASGRVLVDNWDGIYDERLLRELDCSLSASQYRGRVSTDPEPKGQFERVSHQIWLKGFTSRNDSERLGSIIAPYPFGTDRSDRGVIGGQ